MAYHQQCLSTFLFRRLDAELNSSSDRAFTITNWTPSARAAASTFWIGFIVKPSGLISVAIVATFGSSSMAMAADAETSLPSLIEAVKAVLPADRKDALAKRGEAMKKAWDAARERNRVAAAVGWDLSPITTARMCAEIRGAIRNEDWTMVSTDFFQSFWPSRMWTFDRQYRHIGGSGG